MYEDVVLQGASHLKHPKENPNDPRGYCTKKQTTLNFSTVGTKEISQGQGGVHCGKGGKAGHREGEGQGGPDLNFGGNHFEFTKVLVQHYYPK